MLPVRQFADDGIVPRDCHAIGLLVDLNLDPAFTDMDDDLGLVGPCAFHGLPGKRGAESQATQDFCNSDRTRVHHRWPSLSSGKTHRRGSTHSLSRGLTHSLIRTERGRPFNIRGPRPETRIQTYTSREAHTDLGQQIIGSARGLIPPGNPPGKVRIPYRPTEMAFP